MDKFESLLQKATDLKDTAGYWILCGSKTAKAPYQILANGSVEARIELTDAIKIHFNDLVKVLSTLSFRRIRR